jgi:hypothetical protein
MDGGFVYKLRHKTWDIMVKSTSDRDWYSEWNIKIKKNGEKVCFILFGF